MRLLRAIALALATAALLRLLRKNVPVDPRSEFLRASAVLALPTAIAAAWLTSPLTLATDRLRRLVSVTGTSARVLPLGAALVVTALSFGFGVASGAALGLVTAPVLGGWSAAIGLLVLGRARRAEPARVTIAAGILGATALVLVLFAGLVALPLTAVVALLVTVRDCA